MIITSQSVPKVRGGWWCWLGIRQANLYSYQRIGIPYGQRGISTWVLSTTVPSGKPQSASSIISDPCYRRNLVSPPVGRYCFSTQPIEKEESTTNSSSTSVTNSLPSAGSMVSHEDYHKEESKRKRLSEVSQNGGGIRPHLVESFDPNFFVVHYCDLEKLIFILGLCWLLFAFQPYRRGVHVVENYR